MEALKLLAASPDAFNPHYAGVLVKATTYELVSAEAVSQNFLTLLDTLQEGAYGQIGEVIKGIWTHHDPATLELRAAYAFGVIETARQIAYHGNRMRSQQGLRSTVRTYLSVSRLLLNPASYEALKAFWWQNGRPISVLDKGLRDLTTIGAIVQVMHGLEKHYGLTPDAGEIVREYIEREAECPAPATD